MTSICLFIYCSKEFSQPDNAFSKATLGAYATDSIIKDILLGKMRFMHQNTEHLRCPIDFNGNMHCSCEHRRAFLQTRIPNLHYINRPISLCSLFTCIQRGREPRRMSAV